MLVIQNRKAYIAFHLQGKSGVSLSLAVIHRCEHAKNGFYDFAIIIIVFAQSDQEFDRDK